MIKTPGLQTLEKLKQTPFSPDFQWRDFYLPGKAGSLLFKGDTMNKLKIKVEKSTAFGGDYWLELFGKFSSFVFTDGEFGIRLTKEQLANLIIECSEALQADDVEQNGFIDSKGVDLTKVAV